MGLHRVFIRENGITRDLEPFCNCLITSSQTHDGECPLFVSDAAPASASGNASRRAYRAVWRSRLLPVLTVEWQSSTAIAARINAPPHTVLEQLNHLRAAVIVERRIVSEKLRHATRRGSAALHHAQFRVKTA
jgi:hypothetical protein